MYKYFNRSMNGYDLSLFPTKVLSFDIPMLPSFSIKL